MNQVKNYSDRRSDARVAKSALLDKFRAATSAPGLAEKLAARSEIAQARDARRAVQEAEKLKAQELIAAAAAEVLAEEMRQKAAAAAVLEEQARAEAAAIEEKAAAQARRIALVLSDDAARKAARDLRYAKRKAG